MEKTIVRVFEDKGFAKNTLRCVPEIGKWYKFQAKAAQELTGYGKVVKIVDDSHIEVIKYFEIPSYRPYGGHKWFDDLPYAI